MSLKINSGLFSDDFIDHHAVLCVTIDAEVKEIRQRYLQIVRILHPDSSHLVGDLEKEIANSLLSKLVNPAYQKLTGEKKRREYLLILSQMGKRLAQEAGRILNRKIPASRSKFTRNRPIVPSHCRITGCLKIRAKK